MTLETKLKVKNCHTRQYKMQVRIIAMGDPVPDPLGRIFLIS